MSYTMLGIRSHGMHRAEGTAGPGLECPFCGSRDLPAPVFNGYGMATACPVCGARMTEDAATIGTEAHGFIWNSRNQDFRAAGFTGVSVNETGRGCSGGLEDLPAGRVAWADSDGWLWCRMHVDALLTGNRNGKL